MQDQEITTIAAAIEAAAEPVIKLITTIENAVGCIFRPKQIVRVARAEAEAAIIRMGAELETQEMATRAAERVAFREIRRQQHIESILAKAIPQLPASVSTEPVDEDWITQFVNYSQDVSNEEMQMLWARLLAGEIAQPRSFSLRTLHVTRLLRASDAAAFEQSCNHIWDDSYILSISDRTRAHLGKVGLGYDQLLALQSAGLFVEVGDICSIQSGEIEEVTYINQRFRLTGPKDRELGIIMSRHILSEAGKELMRLCTVTPNEEYLLAVKQEWTEEGIRWDPI